MVEIVSQKPRIAIAAWRWPLWVALILFFLTTGTFIALRVYLAQIQANILSINNQIKAEVAKVNVEDENTMVNLSSSLLAFRSLAANHSYFSEFFSAINSLTHTKVAFGRIGVDKEKGQLQLRGTAQNYTALAKQIVALRENKNFNGLEVRGLSFTTSGLEFELITTIDPNIFTKSQ